MIKKICYYIIVISFMLISPLLVAADQKVYTDEDLKKYQPSSQQGVPEEKGVTEEKKSFTIHGTETITVKKDKEYYCKEARRRTRAIERARDNLHAYESGPYRSQRWLVDYQNRVNEAQKDYDDFVEDANRNGISPGWLRCQ